MRGAEAYTAVVQDTTPQHRVVEVVLERAIHHIARAEAAIERRQPLVAHDGLMRAQMAVGALRVALRPEVAPELVSQLDAIYRFTQDRLVQANVRKDAADLPQLRKVLDILRDAFAQAAQREAMQP